jgi:hypothetical protein
MSRDYEEDRRKARRYRIIYDDLSDWWKASYARPDIHGGLKYMRDRLGQPWKSWARPVDYSKNPGWWDRMYSIQPARINVRRQCYDIVRGADPDDKVWPNYKRPKHYFY